jgi:hypothetical protein
MISSLSISDDLGMNETSWKIPFDVVLEVAAFCAGSLEFQTYLNLSLVCKEVHKSLKPVLDEPFLVWNEDTPLWDGFYDACIAGSLEQYLHDVGKDLPDQALYRSKVRYVTWTTSTAVSLKPSLNRYLVIHDAWCFGHTDIYPLDKLSALFPRLRCAIGSGHRGDIVSCQAVLFEPVPVSTLSNLVRGASCLWYSIHQQLHSEIAPPETIKTLYLDFIRISSSTEYPPIDLTFLRPVCDNLVVSPRMDKPIVEIKADMEKISHLSLFYSSLSKQRTAELDFKYWYFYTVEPILFYVSAISAWKPRLHF